LSLSSSEAIVVRHDVPDAKYQASDEQFPQIAYLPEEGQGVLIADQWVVTAAHAVQWRPVKEVILHGIVRPVVEVIVHPGCKKPPKQLQSGDAAPLMAFQTTSNDIALIKLRHPVKDVRPMPIYRGSDEKGKTAEILGKGATGNGLTGEYPGSPHRGQLRRAYSRVIGTDARWLMLKFEAPPEALPLEGMPADGDSGGPVIIGANDTMQLAGLVSWKYATGNLSQFRCCRYGQITYQVRVSRYTDWIDQTIAARATK
jgi:hypothetical protein